MLELWAESEGELIDFLQILDGKIKFDEIYLAKRGVGNNYLTGKYYKYEESSSSMSGEIVDAPPKIKSLVQWCSPDIMISRDDEPVLVIETTYHILTYNNIAQRIPRMIKPVMNGVPSIIFQKVDRLEPSILIQWFTKVFTKATKIYGTFSLSILFDENTVQNKKQELVEICKSSVEDNAKFQKLCEKVLGDMEIFSREYSEVSILNKKKGGLRNWVRIDENKAVVIVGVKPEGSGWKTKGTGLMDPYPGLVKLVDILFCYNDEGKKIRKLVTFFKELPRDFWWFTEYPNEIYYRLVKEFSDEVKYKGEVV